MITGYSVITRGQKGQSSKVHIFKDDMTALCGFKRTGKTQLFKCANWVVEEYIECDKCMKKFKTKGE